MSKPVKPHAVFAGLNKNHLKVSAHQINATLLDENDGHVKFREQFPQLAGSILIGFPAKSTCGSLCKGCDPSGRGGRKEHCWTACPGIPVLTRTTEIAASAGQGGARQRAQGQGVFLQLWDFSLVLVSPMSPELVEAGVGRGGGGGRCGGVRS